jgi:hypothetical protein
MRMRRVPWVRFWLWLIAVALIVLIFVAAKLQS